MRGFFGSFIRFVVTRMSYGDDVELVIALCR